MDDINQYKKYYDDWPKQNEILEAVHEEQQFIKDENDICTVNCKTDFKASFNPELKQ